MLGSSSCLQTVVMPMCLSSILQVGDGEKATVLCIISGNVAGH